MLSLFNWEAPFLELSLTMSLPCLNRRLHTRLQLIPLMPSDREQVVNIIPCKSLSNTQPSARWWKKVRNNPARKYSYEKSILGLNGIKRYNKAVCKWMVGVELQTHWCEQATLFNQTTFAELLHKLELHILYFYDININASASEWIPEQIKNRPIVTATSMKAPSCGPARSFFLLNGSSAVALVCSGRLWILPKCDLRVCLNGMNDFLLWSGRHHSLCGRRTMSTWRRSARDSSTNMSATPGSFPHRTSGPMSNSRLL